MKIPQNLSKSIGENLKELFSDTAGILDDGRIAMFLLVLAFIGCSIYSTYQSGVFDYQGFGVGAGALIAGGGALFGLRKDN